MSTAQRHRQTAQQIVKCQQLLAALGLLDATSHLDQRLGEDHIPDPQWLCHQGIDRHKQGMLRWIAFRTLGDQQALAKPRQLVTQLVILGRTPGPLPDLSQPVRQIFTGVTTLIDPRIGNQRREIRGRLQPQRFHLGDPLQNGRMTPDQGFSAPQTN